MSDKDRYTMYAARKLGISPDQVTTEQREEFKKIAYRQLYSQEPIEPTLAEVIPGISNKPIQGRKSESRFAYEHELTVADLIDYLLTLDGDMPVVTSVFKPMDGLIYKSRVKFSQLKVGRDCLYINSYLKK